MEPRLLVITRNAWADEISTGNTMSNFFSGWQYDIANIFCRDEKINNCICKKYYRITERELIRSLWDKNANVGQKIYYKDFGSIKNDCTNDININLEKQKYTFFKQHRLIIFLWFREIIWKIGKWKNNNINEFLSEFDPNVILIPLYDCWYMYDLTMYVQKYTNAKVIVYTGDDMYTLKQLSISPLFWIDRMVRRTKIRKLINISDLRICLTEKQSCEYSKIFGMKFILSMKSADIKCNYHKEKNEIVQMAYTGNLMPGRYKTLAAIADSVEKINKGKFCIEFHIYSGDKISNHVRDLFKRTGVEFHGNISKEAVDRVQADSDILVHAEDFSLKNKLKTRLSLSTKIVDYLSKGKCVFAVGPADVSSIEYLKKNDAALVVSKLEDIEYAIRSLIDNNDLIEYYENQARECCEKNHDKELIQKRLYGMIEDLVKNEPKEIK